MEQIPLVNGANSMASFLPFNVLADQRNEELVSHLSAVRIARKTEKKK